MNLNDLAKYFNSLKKEIPKAADAYKREIAYSVFELLAFRTPVDEGVAVSNWKVTSKDTFKTQLPAYMPGSRGDTRSINVDFAIGLAREKLTRPSVGKHVYIINNAEHIVRLNEGWSAQAPSNFIESSIIAGLDQNLKFKV